VNPSITQPTEVRTVGSDYSWYPREAANGKAITVTINTSPEIAKQMLATSTGNPRGREGDENIARFSRVMLNGRWIAEHFQGLGFDRDKVMFDGHTRLKALIRAGVTIKMRVNFNAERGGEDQGTARKDAALINNRRGAGFARHGSIAVASRLFFKDRSSILKLTADEKEDLLDAYREIIDFSFLAIPNRTDCKGMTNAPVRAAIARASVTRDRSLLLDFGNILLSGGVDTNHPALRLRKRLIEAKSAGTSSFDAIRYRWTEIALMAYFAGRPLTKLSSTGREWPGECFPLPGESDDNEYANSKPLPVIAAPLPQFAGRVTMPSRTSVQPTSRAPAFA